jgi:RNA recognition motif-containing protein
MLQQIRDVKGGNTNRKVYVANLPYQATEPELKTLFSKAGNVMPLKIFQDRQSGQPRGISFVEMVTQWEGRRAISMLNRQDFLGKICWYKRQRKNVASGEDSPKNLKTVIGTERSMMDKARLDWVMSGLNQHVLTKAEVDSFMSGI